MKALRRIRTGLLALCLILLWGAPAIAASEKGAGADSTIGIEVIDKQSALTIQVKDRESGAYLAGVSVKLTDPDHPDTPPITGSPHGIHMTDANGKIEILLFPDPDKRYQIKVDHLGYTSYVGDIFTVTNDTYKLVELERSGGGGGGGGVAAAAGTGQEQEQGEREQKTVSFHWSTSIRFVCAVLFRRVPLPKVPLNCARA